MAAKRESKTYIVQFTTLDESGRDVPGSFEIKGRSPGDAATNAKRRIKPPAANITITEKRRLSEEIMEEAEKFVRPRNEDKKKEKKEEAKFLCVVCGLPISEKQKYQNLPRDASNSEKRSYHLKECGPASANWKAFKANGKKTLDHPVKGHKNRGKQERTMTDGDGTKTYNPGTQIYSVFEAIKAGGDIDVILKKVAKDCGDGKGNLKNNILWYIGKIRRDGHNVANEDGVYYMKKQQ